MPDLIRQPEERNNNLTGFRLRGRNDGGGAVISVPPDSMVVYYTLAVMDFLDPEKQKAHSRRLALGYALIGLVLVLATTILLYLAYGFGLDREGRVIQNGLIFVSSHPVGADVHVNKQRYKDQTNTRLPLPAGQYTMELSRQGYDTWKRAITVEGGIVERFDYPFLYPSRLQTAITKQYQATPSVVSTSHDRRWLLVGLPSLNEFDLYDLNAKKPAPGAVAVGTDILTVGSTTTGWEVIDWAANNRHVLLKRAYQRNGQVANEYILFDRENPVASQNLSVLFGFTPTSLYFNGRAQDKFYAFDQAGAQVFTVEVKKPTPQPYLSGVLAFAPDGDTVLYITDANASTGKVFVRMRQKTDAPHTIRQLPAGDTYSAELSNYAGDTFAVVGARSENKVYVYENPLAALEDDSRAGLAPVHILKVDAPSYVSFSPGKRIIMAENADRFATYDAETDKGYAYQIAAPLDAPATHASWMDGFRLNVISGGHVVAFDYDGSNTRKLSAANPVLLPGFDRNYRYLYTFNAQNALTNTALLTAEDL